MDRSELVATDLRIVAEHDSITMLIETSSATGFLQALDLRGSDDGHSPQGRLSAQHRIRLDRRNLVKDGYELDG